MMPFTAPRNLYSGRKFEMSRLNTILHCVDARGRAKYEYSREWILFLMPTLLSSSDGGDETIRRASHFCIACNSPSHGTNTFIIVVAVVASHSHVRLTG
mmetsp:Transcript_39046/g.72139  ORF Transcript_39046/g.72139 Transcript_39046/m.72139 type:complete len:99 (+) Transcript_39046:1304-1600(+)